MGKIINTIFGGSNSESKSESGNKSYDWVKGAFGEPGANAYGNALGGMSSVLGSSPEKFFNEGGGKFLLNQGLDDVTSRMSSVGLTRSGAAMKGMEEFRHGLASTYLNNWLGHMGEMGRLGLGGGSITADAGQWSKGKSEGSSSSGGLGRMIGSLLAFSEPELKTNVVHVDTLPDGLRVYDYDYVPGLGLPEGRQRGVMVPDVERLRPWALGPVINGLRTVDYARIGVA